MCQRFVKRQVAAAGFNFPYLVELAVGSAMNCELRAYAISIANLVLNGKYFRFMGVVPQ